MRMLAALLRALWLSNWNRVRRESGLKGGVLTAVSLLLVSAILAIPFYMALQAGLNLGLSMELAPHPDSLSYWCSLQALFIVVSGLLGVFRYRPLFRRDEIAIYPVRRFPLLIAGFAAALFEVFPLLGAGGIFFSNVGLAIRLYPQSPLVFLLAAEGIVAMLTLLVAGGTIRRIVSRSMLTAILAGCLAAGGLLVWLAQGLHAPVEWLPSSQAYAGLLQLRQGDSAGGLIRMALATCELCLAVALAAWLHYRQFLSEEEAPARDLLRASGLVPFRFRRPSVGIARLFVRQLLRSKSGRADLVIPLLCTASMALVCWSVQDARLHHEALYDSIAPYAARFHEVPLLGIYLVLLIPMASEIWMNQFGWDRSGIRTLLSVPVTTREIIKGKAIGLLQFSALQIAISIGPLLWTYTPRWSEVAWGVSAFGIAFLWSAAMGHCFSARFPRAVAPDGAAHLPLYLSWVPVIVMAGIATILVGVGRTAGRLGPWGAPATFAGLLALTLAAYVLMLPWISERVWHERERLLSM